jgi:hypothetical protein
LFADEYDPEQAEKTDVKNRRMNCGICTFETSSVIDKRKKYT